MRRVLALLACYASAVELCNDLLLCTGWRLSIAIVKRELMCASHRIAFGEC